MGPKYKKGVKFVCWFLSECLKIKKEVIQPQVPLRLPCDDLTHLTEFRFVLSKKIILTQTLLGWFDGRCVQGAGTYSPDDANV